MSVVRFAILGACALAWLPASAQKSASECAEEMGDLSGKAREKKMAECLLAHVPPAPPKEPHFVTEIGFHVNSAGGVEPYATVTNPNKGSSIKYMRMHVALYNAVGDQVQSKIGPVKTLLVTGPISYDDEARTTGWDPIAYNHSTACLKISSISVEYMNGKSVTFGGANVKKALHPDLENDCRVRTK